MIVAGDPDAAGIRFWTGRQSLEGMSVWVSDHFGLVADLTPKD